MHEQLGSRDSSLYAGAAECLAWLAQSGISVGVCSNKPHDFCVHLLSNLGVAGYCAAIRGSTAELPLKPDPALLLALVEAMGGELRHTLYVGDSDTDVQLARSAGVPVVLRNNFV